MTDVHILSLGAGVQSTTLFLLAVDGALLCDAAIFADTGDEPRPVYSHLWWLAEQATFPLYIESAGSLGDQLLRGENHAGRRFASIPAFTLHATGERGQVRRQCTADYKIAVVERTIRRTVLGLLPRQRVPMRTTVYQYVGISRDEARRAVRVKERIESRSNWRVHFPLLDRGWTRADCLRWLAQRVPHRVPKSACVFCPYRDNRSWQWLQQHDPDGWRRAVQIDTALRTPGVVVNRGMRSPMFIHSDCVPLSEVDFTRRQMSLGFVTECEGMCGV